MCTFGLRPVTIFGRWTSFTRSVQLTDHFVDRFLDDPGPVKVTTTDPLFDRSDGWALLLVPSMAKDLRRYRRSPRSQWRHFDPTLSYRQVSPHSSKTLLPRFSFPVFFLSVRATYLWGSASAVLSCSLIRLILSASVRSALGDIAACSSIRQKVWHFLRNLSASLQLFHYGVPFCLK